MSRLAAVALPQNLDFFGARRMMYDPIEIIAIISFFVLVVIVAIVAIKAGNEL